MVVQDQGDLPSALKLHEESLALKRSMNDRPGIALSLNNLGLVAFEDQAHSVMAAYVSNHSVDRGLGI